MPERESAISKLFLSCGEEDRAILHGPHCAKQRTEATARDRIEVGGSAQEAERGIYRDCTGRTNI